MNKRHLHHVWRRFQLVPAWYFLLAAVICGTLSVVALRNNNLHMLRLRDAVYQADEKDGNVEAALRQLRAYVYNHMNTNLNSGNNAIYPPIQLKHRYERLIATEKKRVSDANTKIYNDAQIICERQFPQGFFGAGRIPCIEQYVANRGVKEQAIPDSLYKFDFVSPRWSPDVAGWSLLLMGLLVLAAAVRAIMEKWLRTALEE